MNIASEIAAQALASLIERIERLTEEKDAIGADIKEVYSEAKGQGFDTKILRKVIALRRVDASTRQETEEMIDLYMGVLEGRSGD